MTTNQKETVWTIKTWGNIEKLQQFPETLKPDKITIDKDTVILDCHSSMNCSLRIDNTGTSPVHFILVICTSLYDLTVEKNMKDILNSMSFILYVPPNKASTEKDKECMWLQQELSNKFKMNQSLIITEIYYLPAETAQEIEHNRAVINNFITFLTKIKV